MGYENVEQPIAPRYKQAKTSLNPLKIHTGLAIAFSYAISHVRPSLPEFDVALTRV